MDYACGPSASLVFSFACLTVFAVLLQTPMMQQRYACYMTGLALATTTLIVSPIIQKTTINTCLDAAYIWCTAGLSILYWTFVAPRQHTPTILQVCLSIFTHPIEGVIEAHQRSLRKDTKHGQHVLWSMLREAITALLAAHIAWDIGVYLLCDFSSGMCRPPGVGGATAMQWSKHPVPKPTAHLSYLSKCAFAFPAGILIAQRLDTIYLTIRLVIILAAFWSPSLATVAANTPTSAFKFPVAAPSVTELWGVRWQQLCRIYFKGLGGTAVDALLATLPGGKSTPRGLRAALHCVAAFIVSGLLHEYITWAWFGSISGWQMAFFMVHCLLVLLERIAPVILSKIWTVAAADAAAAARGRDASHVLVASKAAPLHADCSAAATAFVSRVTKSSKASSSTGDAGTTVSGPYSSSSRRQPQVPAWFKHMWTLSVFILTGPLFMEPLRLSGLFSHPGLHPFGAPLTPHLLHWLQGALSITRGL